MKPYEEECVVGGVLVSGADLPKETLDIEPEFFTDSTLAKVWASIRKLIDHGDDIDPVTVSFDMRGDGHGDCVDYLSELMASCPSASNLKVWMDRLSEAGRLRCLNGRVRQALESHEDALSLAGDLNLILNNASHWRRDGGLKQTKEMLGAVLDELQEEHENPMSSIIAQTGIDALDNVARMRPGELTLLAARPSMGKTALAGNIVSHVAREKPVAFFSLEMTSSSLLRRLISSISEIDSSALARRIASNRIVEAFNTIHKLKLSIDDRPGLTTAGMRNELNRAGEVGLVVVDYLQLCGLSERKETHALDIGGITKDLKHIAKEFNCHVLALSQLNRNVESRSPPRPRLSDLRDSGNLEEDADNVWFLYRPGYYAKDPGDDSTEVIISKQRQGPTGAVELRWLSKTQTFVAA